MFNLDANILATKALFYFRFNSLKMIYRNWPSLNWNFFFLTKNVFLHNNCVTFYLENKGCFGCRCPRCRVHPHQPSGAPGLGLPGPCPQHAWSAWPQRLQSRGNREHEALIYPTPIHKNTSSNSVVVVVLVLWVRVCDHNHGFLYYTRTDFMPIATFKIRPNFSNVL